MARTSGFDGPGDGELDAAGRFTPRRLTGAASASLNYMGVHVVDLRPVYDHPETAFGLFPLWAAWAREGRLKGAVMRGDWMHVGDPAARDVAEARLGRARTAAA